MKRKEISSRKIFVIMLVIGIGISAWHTFFFIDKYITYAMLSYYIAVLLLLILDVLINIQTKLEESTKSE